MRSVQLLLHVFLAGVYVFLTSVTVLVQLGAAERSVLGLGALVLLGAWAGASSTVRTASSLFGAAAGALTLAGMTASSHFYGSWVRLWMVLVMLPLVFLLWCTVAWRWASEFSPRSTRGRARPAET